MLVATSLPLVLPLQLSWMDPAIPQPASSQISQTQATDPKSALMGKQLCAGTPSLLHRRFMGLLCPWDIKHPPGHVFSQESSHHHDIPTRLGLLHHR